MLNLTLPIDEDMCKYRNKNLVVGHLQSIHFVRLDGATLQPACLLPIPNTHKVQEFTSFWKRRKPSIFAESPQLRSSRAPEIYRPFQGFFFFFA